jgi:hypothetical protein
MEDMLSYYKEIINNIDFEEATINGETDSAVAVIILNRSAMERNIFLKAQVTQVLLRLYYEKIGTVSAVKAKNDIGLNSLFSSTKLTLSKSEKLIVLESLIDILHIRETIVSGSSTFNHRRKNIPMFPKTPFGIERWLSIELLRRPVYHLTATTTISNREL